MVYIMVINYISGYLILIFIIMMIDSYMTSDIYTYHCYPAL